MENPATLETLDNEVKKMPSVSSKRILTHFDYGAIYASKLLKSICEGTSPFLPGEDGILKTNGVYNMRTNSLHHGISQIMLKERQAELGSPTGAFVSYEMVEKAQKAGFDCHVIKGEHGFDIVVQNPDDLKEETIKWFNESQIQNPENLRSFFTEKMQKNAADVQKWLDANKPGKTAKDASIKNPGRENTEIRECTAKSPEEYLGQVFAAMSTGYNLKVSNEIKDMFVIKTSEILTKEYKPGQKDKLAIFKLASKANEICKTLCKELHKEKAVQKKVEKESPSFER